MHRQYRASPSNPNDTTTDHLSYGPLMQIHQPSAQLFERFDRLMFLAKGGRTVYFGEVGKGSRTLVDYLVRNGAEPCPEEANPAEWMLQAIGAAPGYKTDVDWPRVWQESEEKQEVKRELEVMRSIPAKDAVKGHSTEDDALQGEFASTYRTQFVEVTKRVAQFYWRNPTYIYSKLVLVIGTVSIERLDTKDKNGVCD